MKIALVSSKGGHLGQIKILFTEKVIGKNNAILVTENESGKGFDERGFLGKYKVYFFKKDSLGFNPFNYLSSFFKMIRIYRKENIEIVFTNGAQISIPAVMAAKFIGIKTVFIDTVIRVKTPNWSARACYPFSDIFLVQHENMKKKYGKKARFEGGIV